MSQADPAPYTLAEEKAHAWTHGVGALLSVAALVWMLSVSIGQADPWRIVASTVYGLSMIALFAASTVYHSVRDVNRRHFFKVIDHCAIYLLIAGTYTPFVLVAMRDATGWWLFGAIWTLALAGIAKKVFLGPHFARLSMASYLLMGWLVVLAGPQVAAAVGATGMRWLVAGGICYTVGAVFYAMKRMPWHHVIWHVFVLGGCTCHFLAVMLYVLP